MKLTKIKNLQYEVTIQERIDNYHVKNEKTYYFHTLEDVYLFIQGKQVIDKFGVMIEKKQNQEIEMIEIYGSFKEKQIKELYEDLKQEELEYE